MSFAQLNIADALREALIAWQREALDTEHPRAGRSEEEWLAEALSWRSGCLRRSVSRSTSTPDAPRQNCGAPGSGIMRGRRSRRAGTRICEVETPCRISWAFRTSNSRSPAAKGPLPGTKRFSASDS